MKAAVHQQKQGVWRGKRFAVQQVNIILFQTQEEGT